MPSTVNRSASLTTEYAHDDFALAHLAAAAGDMATHDALIERSHGWRALYDPATGDIDWSAAGMRTMIPWYPMLGISGEPFPFELFWNDGPISSARIEFDGGTRGALLAVGNDRAYVRLSTDEPGLGATLDVTGLGTGSPTVTIERPSRRGVIDLEVAWAPEPGSTLRRYTLRGVEILPGIGSTLRLAITPTSEAVVTGGSASRATLDYEQLASDPARRFGSLPEPVVPIAGARVSPDKWRRASSEGGE